MPAFEFMKALVVLCDLWPWLASIAQGGKVSTPIPFWDQRPPQSLVHLNEHQQNLEFIKSANFTSNRSNLTLATDFMTTGRAKQSRMKLNVSLS